MKEEKYRRKKYKYKECIVRSVDKGRWASRKCREEEIHIQEDEKIGKCR